jgi:cell division protein FtsW (lipid II flippase)
MLGLVMVLSATSANSVGGTESPYATFSRQLVWAGLGLAACSPHCALPYQRWRSFVIPGRCSLPER